MMKISVAGSGYVGLVTAIGWADKGHDVTCIDIDENKVSLINSKKSPFYEKGVNEKLEALDIAASSSFDSVKDSDMVFIAVGTPSLPSGEIDLSYIKSCSASIADNLPTAKFPIIILRSTVIPGTTEDVMIPILEKNGLKAKLDFGVAMMPEFLREGTALSDFSSPDRLVMGPSDEKTRKILEGLVRDFDCPKLFTNIKTAELIKYASNAMLATRVSFTNDFARICHECGADIDHVMKGTGLDSRIGERYLVAGPGFGGACLPKDVSALAQFSDSKLMKAVLEVNDSQIDYIIAMMEKELGSLSNKTIAILGLAFKAGTDDVRTSQSIPMIHALIAKGANVRGCDPKAVGNAKKLLDMEYCTLEETAGCDAALLLTAWPEFMKDAKFYKKLLKDAPFFDMRRILDQKDAIKEKLNYHAFGRG